MRHRALSRKFLRIINRLATRRPPIIVPRAAFAQPLEPRRLLSALVINGGSGNDSMTISLDSNFIYALVNGIQIPQPRSFYDAITVNGLGGNDDILIKNTGTGEPIDIFPGDGADEIDVCAYQSFDASDHPEDLDQIADRVYVHAGTDSTDDILLISDAADAGDDAYNIVEDGPMKLRKPGASSPDKVFWGESNLHTTIFLNDGDNAVDINSSVALDGTDETLTLSGGIGAAGPGSLGNDTVTFSGEISNGNLIEFFGGGDDDTFLVTAATFSTSASLSFDGGAGIDLLTVTDPGLTNSYTFNSAGNRLSIAVGANSLTIDYTGLDKIALNSAAPTLNSTFNIDGLGADLVVAAGGGNDTFVVGDGSISTADFGTTIGLILDGGSGNDSITFDDSNSSANQGVTFGNETFDHNNLDTVICNSIATATINLGSGNETVTLGTDHGAFTQITVNGGAGADTFSVQPVPGTVITVNGQNPTTAPGDQVQLTANGQNGGIFGPNAPGDGAYAFPNGADIFFTGMESFTQPDSALPPPDLATADDTGRSSTDNVTKKTSLTFSGTAAHGTVRLFRDGTQIATTAAAANGSYSFSAVTFPTGDDTFAMTVADDSLLSGLIANESLALNVHVDTIVPAAPPVPDLSFVSDSGKLDDDNLTKDNTPTIAGTAAASANVQLFSGATQVGSGTADALGSYAIVSSTLADGVRKMTVTQDDLAGNLSNPSAALAFTIDTVAPAPPTAAPDLQAASDSGLSSTDNITNDNTPTFTVNGSELMQLFVNSVIAVDYASPPDITATTISDGTPFIAARSVDLAGNASSQTNAIQVTIDTTPPGPPVTVPDLQAASDSGVSSTDNVTKVTTPTFTVSGTERIRLLDGTTILVDYAVPPNITTPALADGFHNIAARSIDLAGNVSTDAKTIGITIDTQRPTVPNAAFAFDTAQAINYTFSEDVSSTVTLADFSLQNLTTPTTFLPGSIALAATPGNVSSFAAVTFPGFPAGLPDGNYRATLTAAGITDLAGNALAANHILDFFVLAGDANHDRTVGFADLVVLAQHYGQTAGTTFSTGDLNYDGTIGFADLVLVAQHYGTTLPAPAVAAQGVFADAALAPVTQAAVTRSPFSLIPVKKALRRQHR